MAETGTGRPGWSAWPMVGFGIIGVLVLLTLTGVMLSGAAGIPPEGRSVSVTVRSYQPQTGELGPVVGESVSAGAIPAAVLDGEDLAAVAGPVRATWSSTLGQTVRSLRRDRAGELPATIPLAERSMYPDRYTFLLTHLDSDGQADQLLARVVVRVAQ